MMNWHFDNDRPIYTQIIESMKLFIVSGELKPGDKVPPVRELAAEAEVNPNTMQRALSDLERDGLLYTNRTSGRFVTENVDVIEAMKLEIARKSIAAFLTSMEKIGYSRAEILELLKNFKSGDDNS